MKVMFVTLLAIFISGCSTVFSKIPSNSAMGIPYSGTEYALLNMFNCNLLALKEYPLLLPIDLLPLDTSDNHKQKNSVVAFILIGVNHNNQA